MHDNRFPKSLRISGQKRIDSLFRTGRGGFRFPFRYIVRVSDAAEAAYTPGGDASGENGAVVAAGAGESPNQTPQGTNPNPGETQGGVSFLISVSKRYHKRAVRRNRIKRLAREALRTNKNALWQTAAAKGKRLEIAFLYSTKEVCSHGTIRNSITKILEEVRESL